MKVHRFAGFSVAVLFALALPAMAQAQTPFTTISSSGPIENIDLGDELSCQVDLAGDATFSFFPEDSRPGDCGTFLTVATDEFGPDFDNHDGGSAFGPGNGMAYSPFTPVSQTAPSGAGTPADPFTVTTVVDAIAVAPPIRRGAGGGGIRVTQVDSYVTGNKFYDTQVTVTNNGSSTLDAELYRAGDCFLAGSDSGFGFEIPSTGSIFCAESANNTPAGRLIGFQPQSAGSTYLEDSFGTVWDEIDSDLFSNLCVECPNDIDNGIGISWALSIPAGGSTSRSLITSIDPTGDVDAPETTITSGPADGSTSSDTTPTFGFTSDEAGSTFECSIDGGPFTPCSSGDTFGPLADAAHTFQVRATDPAGNTDPTPASRSFTISTGGPDTDPPDTTITTGPAEGSTSADSTPTFGFTSDEAGSTFECSIDGGPFTACTPGDTFGPLADGAHTFRVRATDPSGNTDPTPASRSFTVDQYAPAATCKGEAASVVGTPDGDVLTGTPGDDVIAAGAGNDQIDAGGGDDLICTDAGDDVLAPGDGDDDAFGDAGNDNLSGGAGRDDLSGAAGNDTISGGDDNDNIGGDDGNDNLGGGAGNDNVGASTGDDVVGGGSGNDNINGSGGADDLGGGGGNDNIGAGPGADTIGGDAGSDIISADGGDDSVVGSGGEDQIGGGNGADTLAGSNGDDTLLGGSAIDTLLGGIGDDFLHGGTGPDTCQGGSGTNQLLSC